MTQVSFMLRALSDTMADYAAQGLAMPPAYMAEIARLLASLAALAGSSQQPEDTGNVVYVDFINRRTPPTGGDAA